MDSLIAGRRFAGDVGVVRESEELDVRPVVGSYGLSKQPRAENAGLTVPQ